MRLRYKLIITFTLSLLLWSCTRDQITDSIDNTIAPATPSDLRVYAAYDGAVGIEWSSNNEPNLKGYNIYRSINNTQLFKLLAFTTNNYFVNDSLEYDSTYYYKISAVNQGGKESPLTSYVSAQPKNLYAPLPPNNVSINARNWSNSIAIKLSWNPSTDTDVKGYNIYRSVTSGFDADTTHYLDFTPNIFYYDSSRVQLLTDYYYRIKAVDKSGLKSPATSEIKDVILNAPRLIYPDNNSTINTISEFHFMAVSRPASYKLVIQSNEIYGTIKEIDLSSDIVDQEIKVDLTGLQLDLYKTYVWRVFTYTASDTDPNSFSNYFTFTYVPF